MKKHHRRGDSTLGGSSHHGGKLGLKPQSATALCQLHRDWCVSEQTGSAHLRRAQGSTRREERERPGRPGTSTNRLGSMHCISWVWKNERGMGWFQKYRLQFVPIPTKKKCVSASQQLVATRPRIRNCTTTNKLPLAVYNLALRHCMSFIIRARNEAE